jgi:hypothetical protein
VEESKDEVVINTETSQAKFAEIDLLIDLHSPPPK